MDLHIENTQRNLFRKEAIAFGIRSSFRQSLYIEARLKGVEPEAARAGATKKKPAR